MKKQRIIRSFLLAAIAFALGATGCGDDPGGSAGDGGTSGTGGAGGGGTGGSLGPPGFGFVMGEEGSNFTVRLPDGSEESIGLDVLFGWNNGQLLSGDYYKQLRIGTTMGTMELRMSFPSTAPPTGLIEGVHQLRPSRLFLEDTGDLEEVQVEVYFQRSDPPFDPFTNAVGEVEIFLDADNGISVYDIAGNVNLEIAGADGRYVITGSFWAREIEQ